MRWQLAKNVGSKECLFACFLSFCLCVFYFRMGGNIISSEPGGEELLEV